MQEKSETDIVVGDFKKYHPFTKSMRQTLQLENEMKNESVKRKHVIRSCCFECDKRAVKYFVQLILTFTILIFCLVGLFLDSSCEKTSIYIPLITGVSAYWLPAPSP